MAGDRYDSSYSGEDIDQAVGLALENLPITLGTLSVTLLAANWSGNTQTVTAAGITGAENIIVTPAPESFEAYGSALVRCTTIAFGELTFVCSSVPSADLSVNILRIGEAST